jgi:hypothetical protein
VPPAKESPPESTSTQQTQSAPGQNQDKPSAPIPALIVNASGSTSPRADNTTENSREESQDRLAFWVAVSTIAVGIFTAGLLAVAFLQWRWTRKTVESMEDTAERQLRAYITLCIDNRNGPAGAKGAAALKIDAYTQRVCGAICRIRNAGQTPAYDVVARGVLKILPYPQSKEWKRYTIDRTLMTSRFVLGPQQESDIGCEAEDAIFMRIPDKSAFYIYGRIEYRDAFNQSRVTDYCFVGGLENGVFASKPAEYGNEAT